MATFQPYGGLGWPLACLLPPSAVSLFATVLLKLEGSQRGVTWDTFNLQITSQFPFSAATVFGMLALDVALYSALAWYLDKVSCPLCLLCPRPGPSDDFLSPGSEASAITDPGCACMNTYAEGINICLSTCLGLQPVMQSLMLFLSKCEAQTCEYIAGGAQWIRAEVALVLSGLAILLEEGHWH